MTERPRTSLSVKIAGTVALVGSAFIVACGGAKGEGTKNTPDTGPQKPAPTETIAPTLTPSPTEIPTAVPTAEPTKPPTTQEELKQLFNNASAAINIAYGGAGAVSEDVKNKLAQCNNGELSASDRLSDCGNLGSKMIKQ